jgi:IclR family acetate operon transcriptional repressor
MVSVKPRGQHGATLPRVRAVSRAISILRAFSADRPFLALNEIVRATGLDAGTSRRILVTLRDEGMVYQDPASGLYSASTGLLALARAVPRTLTLASLVDQRLTQLAEDSQTTVYLSVCSGDEALCVSRVNGGRAIEVRWWAVGETRAFNHGTGPRVLLAYLPEAERERIIAGPLGLDLRAADSLRRELEAIVESGFIVKHDEIAAGISAMAIPLLDESGAILGAISTGGLTPRYIGAAQAELLSMTQRAAEDMQRAVRGAGV